MARINFLEDQTPPKGEIQKAGKIISRVGTLYTESKSWHYQEKKLRRLNRFRLSEPHIGPQRLWLVEDAEAAAACDTDGLRPLSASGRKGPALSRP